MPVIVIVGEAFSSYQDVENKIRDLESPTVFSVISAYYYILLWR